MKKRSLVALGATALALAICIPLVAFAHGPGHKGWGDGGGRGDRGDKLAEKLGLNDAQKTELKALREDMQTDVQDIHEQIKTRHEAMKALWTAATPDRAKILAATKEIGALEQQIAELRVDFMLAAKSKLTPEQFAKFLEMKGRHGERGMRGHRGGGKFRGGEHGGRGGRGPGAGFGDDDGADEVR